MYKCFAYRIEVGLFGGNAGLMLPFKPYGVRGVSGKAGVSGRGDPATDVSGSVSDLYDENDSSRTYLCFFVRVNKSQFNISSKFKKIFKSCVAGFFCVIFRSLVALIYLDYISIR